MRAVEGKGRMRAGSSGLQPVKKINHDHLNRALWLSIMCKMSLLSVRYTGLIIQSDLYEMHLPLFETHAIGAAVIADMDPTQ